MPDGNGGDLGIAGWEIWEWDLRFRWEWEWDGNGNEVIEMGRICYEKSMPARLYLGAHKPNRNDKAVPPLVGAVIPYPIS